MDKPRNLGSSREERTIGFIADEGNNPSACDNRADPDPFADFGDFEISLLESADIAGAGVGPEEDTEWFLSSLSSNDSTRADSDDDADEDNLSWQPAVEDAEEALPFEQYMRSLGASGSGDDMGGDTDSVRHDFPWDSLNLSTWDDTSYAWDRDEDVAGPRTVFHFGESDELVAAEAFEVEEPVMAEAFEVEEPVMAEAFEVEEPVMAEAFEVEEPVMAEAIEVEEPVMASSIGAEVSAAEQSDAERRFMGAGGPAELTESEITQRHSAVERAFQVLRRTALLATDASSVRADLFEIVDANHGLRSEEFAQGGTAMPEAPGSGNPASDPDSPSDAQAAVGQRTIVIGRAREATSEPMLTSTPLSADYRKAYEGDADSTRSAYFEEMAAKNEVFSNTMEIDARKLESYTGQWQAAQQQALRPEARPDSAATVATVASKRRWLRKKRS